jgi:endonuclease/exonuclease/phosphatase family metal-dependent hydrolase
VLFRPLAALPLAVVLVAGCDPGGGDARPDGGLDAAPDASIYEPPRDDLVPAVGDDSTIDIASWNIQNFPRASATPRLVADLIASMRLDLVAVQEIEDVAAFDELVARLPEHGGLLSSHTYGNGSYQKVGFIYRESLLDLTGGALLFSGQGFDFPRPPLQVQVTVEGKTVLAIVVHLKAGVSLEDAQRRTAAIATLEDHLRTLVDGDGEDDVIVLGDFNQTRTTTADDEVWAPIVTAPERYTVVTEAAADAGEVTYLPFGGRMLDHAVTTAGFELGDPDVVVPHLDEFPIDYQGLVSDHRPVVVRFPR